MSDAQIVELGAATLARLIRDGRVSAEQVTLAFLERGKLLARLGLNAVIESAGDVGSSGDDGVVECEALRTARALDRWQREHNRTVGPLHGVPVSVKDHIGVAGMVQAFGLARFRQHRAAADSTVVARLRRAGAVVLYKTNMPELGLSFDTANPSWGRTANPYDLQRSAGGSSGGDGALVAARGVPLAVGSDVGGSVRIPASWNGLCALKPSQGRLPLTGASLPELGELWEFFEGYSDCLVLGPMSRHVDDLELVLQLASGGDFADPQAQLPPYPARPPAVDLPALRVGYFTAHAGNRASPDVVRAVDATVAALRQLGVQSVVAIDTMPLVADVVTYIGRLVARGGCTAIFDLIDYGSAPLSPSLRPLVDICSAWKLDRRDDYDQLRLAIARYRSNVLRFFADYDLLVGPTTATPAALPTDMDDIGPFAYTIAWNVAQMPVLALGPILLAEEPHYRGLPVGVSLIVPPYQDHVALAVGSKLQQVIPMTSYAPTFANAHQD